MARRGDHPKRLKSPGPRPPVVREFSAGGLVYRGRGSDCAVVLAARRHPQRGTLVWGIPKGHVEAGESSAEAAVREVREETGLEAAIEVPLGDLRYWYVRKDEAGAPVRVLKQVRFFLMRHRGGRFADRDHEMDAVSWFPVADAEVAVGYENERALVQKARKRLEGDGTE
jgi:8-oxo-dGTP pyrophosphatase MutT (NUDIX family)